MMDLKERVLAANLELPQKGLVLYTWGNVSEIDRQKGLVCIKPSGVPYEGMKAEDMVIVDLEGNVVEGNLKPSSDTATHLALYKAFPEIGGIVHTHSTYATTFAQAGKDIPALGTTHADYFFGAVPCTRSLSKEEIEGDYETETGNVIIDEFRKRHLAPLDIPAVLVKNHGVFTWGKDGKEAVYHAVVVEQVARMAYQTLMLNPKANMSEVILKKHYNRKHGVNAYYGQK